MDAIIKSKSVPRNDDDEKDDADDEEDGNRDDEKHCTNEEAMFLEMVKDHGLDASHLDEEDSFGSFFCTQIIRKPLNLLEQAEGQPGSSTPTTEYGGGLLSSGVHDNPTYSSKSNLHGGLSVKDLPQNARHDFASMIDLCGVKCSPSAYDSQAPQVQAHTTI